MICRLLRLATSVAVFGIVYAWSTWSGGQEMGNYATTSGTMIQPGALAGDGGRPWEYGNPDLFYNFYAPNNSGGVPAPLYVAPYPVPQVVGQSYYTYQPLMPQEFLYKHHRHYTTIHKDAPKTRTSVHWR